MTDEAIQTAESTLPLDCFVGAGARSQRRSRLLAMTVTGNPRISNENPSIAAA
jgi:hypothetical protein